MKDWEGDEAPAVGMAVKCRVVHATGLQGTGSVCVMCVCVCHVFVCFCALCALYVFVCVCHVCVMYVCVCCVASLWKFFGIRPCPGCQYVQRCRTISQLRSTKRRRE